MALALSVSRRPDTSQMDEFTASVAMWLKLDSEIKRLLIALRERRCLKRHLTERIVAFMRGYGIDDLDTLECRLSCRARQVRTPLPHSLIHERLSSMYAGDPVAARLVTDVVFNRGRVERVSLRRSSGRQVTSSSND